MKLFLFLSLFSCSVFATTIRVPPSANVSTSGTKTVIDMVKQGGDHVQTPRGAAAAERALAANGALRNQNALDIAAQNARRNVPTTSPMPASSLAKKVMKVGGAIGTAAIVVCTVVEVLSGKSCEQRRSEGIQAVRDWLDHGALGTDVDGNPTENLKNLICSDSSKSLDEACAKSPAYALHLGAVSASNSNYLSYGGIYTSSTCSVMDASGTVVRTVTPVCRQIDDTVISIPISFEKAEKKLADTPITPSEVDKIVEGNDAIATATGDNSIEIEGEQPTINDGDYTHKNDSPSTKNTNPQGEVLEKKESIDCAKASPTTLECQKTTDTQVTKPDGSVTHDVTAEAPTIEDLGLEKNTPSQPTSGGIDCKATPDLIVCSKWGVAPTAEKLPVKEVPITINNSSLGAGTCPAPKIVTLSGGKSYSMSYEPYCDFFTLCKPIVLAFSWLAAGFLVINSARES